jgi:hypothetical protein
MSRSTFRSYVLWRWLEDDTSYWRGWRRFRAAWFTLTDGWYYLSCLLWHRWNVLRIDSLGPTYTDCDTIMLHAAFQCLVNVVEKGGLYEGWRLDDIASHVAEQTEDWSRAHIARQLEGYVKIRDLYVWWTVTRPARDAGEYKDEHDAEDQAKFMELAAMREWLWT